MSNIDMNYSYRMEKYAYKFMWQNRMKKEA